MPDKYAGKPCQKCGEPLTTDNYVEFDQPMTRGNPYPESIVVCKKTECMAAAQTWTLLAEEAAAQEDQDYEDDYEE